jgi:ubiquinone/menaquinone biosynthesis C-methylase UbiE
VISQRLRAALLPAPGPVQLARLLQPAPGEHVLEVRPGTGRHARHIAHRLGARGRLELVDVPAHMLEEARRRTVGVEALVMASVADPRSLPFDRAAVDAAYLVAALGTLPNPGLVLRELRRVLRPCGRLVVADHWGPSWMPLPALQQLARSHGFVLERCTGNLRYVALFRPSPNRSAPVDIGHPAAESNADPVRHPESRGTAQT